MKLQDDQYNHFGSVSSLIQMGNMLKANIEEKSENESSPIRSVVISCSKQVEPLE